eukprot:Skav204179  [mRNA]  locus=scaffold903:612501:622626:+ [translate_table: standard]
MHSEPVIRITIPSVQHQPDQVEPGHQVLRQLDVLNDRELGIVAGICWICGGQDSSSGIQGAHDTGLRNADGLLLHDFMKNCSGILIHLVKLIDTAKAAVRQNEGTTLQDQLLGHRIFVDGGGQTHGTAAFARGVYPSRCQLVGVLQQLRLCRRRVATQQSIDLGSASPLGRDGLWGTSKELTKQTFLHLIFFKNGGCKGVDQLANNRVVAGIVLLLR